MAGRVVPHTQWSDVFFVGFVGDRGNSPKQREMKVSKVEKVARVKLKSDNGIMPAVVGVILFRGGV